jgi:hypothetical protein
MPCRQHVGPVPDLPFLAAQSDRLDEREHRMQHLLSRTLRLALAHQRWNEAGRFPLEADDLRTLLRGPEIDQRLPIVGQERIEIDQRPDPRAVQRRNAGHHHAAVGMADEHQLLDPLVVDDFGDIADVEAEIDGGIEQVRPVAEPGEGRA